MRGAKAHMKGAIRSIKVETIEGQILNDPISNLSHVFIFNDEVAGCA
jgi:hypothetical protein